MEMKGWMLGTAYLVDVSIWLGISYLLFTKTDEFYLALVFAIAFPFVRLSWGNDIKPNHVSIPIFFVLALSVSYFYLPNWASNLNSKSNTTVTQEVTPTPKKLSTKEQLKYSAKDACEDISTIQYEYFQEFEEFRYRNNGQGWAPLGKLTNKATKGLDESIRKMRNGIEWDSFAITSSMLSAASSYMTEIVDSSNRGFFSPGRDVEALLQEIEINLTSVANSACN